MISFCNTCKFPKTIEINDHLTIEKWTGDSWSKPDEVYWNEEVCPHIIENRQRIMEIIDNVNKINELDIDYITYEWHIECRKCLQEDKRKYDYWLSNIVLFLKGIKYYEKMVKYR